MPELPPNFIVTIYDDDESDKFLLDDVACKPGIYAIINCEKGHWYIGSSARLRQRARDHRKGLRNDKHYNKHLQHAWNKYGEGAFQFRVIEYCQEGELIDREQHWLDVLVPEYNIAKVAGSTKGIKHPPLSAEHVKKIIQANTGRVVSEETRRLLSKRKMGQGKGVPLTEQHRSRISRSLKGRILTQQHKEKLSKALKGRLFGFALTGSQKTHCPHGHPYNEENTGYQFSHGRRSRYCKECKRFRDKKRYDKKRKKP